MKQVLVISGKGGTGKTTLVSSFIKLGEFKAFADCDVDAPNLNLIIKENNLKEKFDYFGMDKCEIDEEKCVNCMKCIKFCKFNAIIHKDNKISINKYFCEGCGVCEYICPNDAIKFAKNKAGDIKIYEDENFMSTAKLKMGEGNSGLLVTEVKKNLRKSDAKYAIIDGSPGIGCPVMASLTGVDIVIIVTEPSVTGLNDLKRLYEMISNFDMKVFIVINKYDLNLDIFYEIKKYCAKNNLEIIGKIPFEKDYNNFLNDNKTLLEMDNLASLEIKNIYNKILNNLRRK